MIRIIGTSESLNADISTCILIHLFLSAVENSSILKF
jgi:hypothetical protein